MRLPVCLVIILISLTSNLMVAQTIDKPLGCFAGTNGTHPAVLDHADARGVLLMEPWLNLETSPGVFNFSALDAKISAVTSEGLKYALGIPAGAFGSPDWLIDNLGADYFGFYYREEAHRLPLWWDSTVQARLDTLITELGDRYGADSSLSHVYVSQMTSNGLEGHLNGVNMYGFRAAGYHDTIWTDRAIRATELFLESFPNKPIVFEVHEIDHDTVVPAAILNHFYDDPDYCNRVGLGMWWISGKTTYQTDLLTYIENSPMDKYAQVIARSDMDERFEGGDYGSVFLQAKTLGVRYIEPWPYEFQHATNDSLFEDFNDWVDLNFTTSDYCPAALPVGYVDFSADYTEGEVELSWITRDEKDNDGFEVQKSTNGIDWKVIDFIKGHGTTVGQNAYRLYDSNPSEGANYYRLNQIDLDGGAELSNMVLIDHIASAGNIRIYPNPTKGAINIRIGEGFGQEADFKVSVFSANGEKILEAKNQNCLNLDYLAAGLYFVEVQTNGQREVTKVILE